MLPGKCAAGAGLEVAFEGCGSLAAVGNVAGDQAPRLGLGGVLGLAGIVCREACMHVCTQARVELAWVVDAPKDVDATHQVPALDRPSFAPAELRRAAFVPSGPGWLASRSPEGAKLSGPPCPPDRAKQCGALLT